MGLEQQQKYIQVTESWYPTNVQYHIPMGWAQAVRRNIAHHKTQIHMEIQDITKIDTRIPLGAVEDFCLCVQPGNKCLSESQRTQ